MKEYDVKHKLCTITAGVDKSYSKQIRSVPLEEILEHLGQGHIAVVLIDWNVVYQQMCTDRIKCLPSVSCVRNCVNIYQGHFIIACGYSKKDKLIFYHNPATGTSSRDGSSMPMKIFEVARKSYGTDEDILFIFKNHTV
ncbi:hypothetical protein LSH36_641g00004 [Paralvinella palmiformis]|uniref:Uncharacterized protein n=1 Tax=Paralvinella palmiformis TaxID=53620 RepID=A0AAD9MWV5_9ANNE|nr:hypothetical protein LSH36_641g00004 [Paralvinella palmiformis]